MQVAYVIWGMRQGFQIRSQILGMCINLAGAHARFTEKNQKSIMHIKFYVFWSKNANMKFKHPYLCRLRAVFKLV